MLCVLYDLPHGYMAHTVYHQIRAALIWQVVLAYLLHGARSLPNTPVAALYNYIDHLQV